MKKGTSTRPEVFMALAQAYEIGNTTITDRVEAILTPNEVPLPEALQTVLEKLGDTPIAEPKLFATLKDGSMEEFSSECGKLVDLDAVDAVMAGMFIARVRARILTDVDKDGVFKTTPSLDKMRLPKLSEVKQITDLAEKGCTDVELEAFILSIAGLSEVQLTDWEKQLVMSIMTAYAQSATHALIGKVTDRTPFSRYLKNI